MKSTIKFDLRDLKPVITANVILTDDIRDKVAKTFFEKLGGTSQLCFVSVPNIESSEGTIWEIQPVGWHFKSLESLLKNINETQLNDLASLLPEEIERRKNNGYLQTGFDYIDIE